MRNDVNSNPADLVQGDAPEIISAASESFVEDTAPSAETEPADTEPQTLWQRVCASFRSFDEWVWALNTQRVVGMDLVTEGGMYRGGRTHEVQRIDTVLTEKVDWRRRFTASWRLTAVFAGCYLLVASMFVLSGLEVAPREALSIFGYTTKLHQFSFVPLDLVALAAIIFATSFFFLPSVTKWRDVSNTGLLIALYVLIQLVVAFVLVSSDMPFVRVESQLLHMVLIFLTGATTPMVGLLLMMNYLQMDALVGGVHAILLGGSLTALSFAAAMLFRRIFAEIAKWF